MKRDDKEEIYKTSTDTALITAGLTLCVIVLIDILFFNFNLFWLIISIILFICDCIMLYLNDKKLKLLLESVE